MLLTLTLDDASGTPVVLHETSKRALSGVSGLIGVAPVRTSIRDRPQGHGVLNQTRYEGQRLIVLEGEIFSQTSQADAEAEFHEITRPMYQTLDIGPALMKWTEGSNGLQLQRLVGLVSDVDPRLAEGASRLEYQAQFTSEDPRAYSQTLQSVSSGALSSAAGGLTFNRTFPILFNPSTAGVATVTNNGKRSTPPVFRIYGGCTNPVITKVSTQEKFTLVGAIATGDYVEVDVAARTVKLNGSSNAMYMLDSANSSWFEISPGSETFSLIAPLFDSNALLSVRFRDAY